MQQSRQSVNTSLLDDLGERNVTECAHEDDQHGKLTLSILAQSFHSAYKIVLCYDSPPCLLRGLCLPVITAFVTNPPGCSVSVGHAAQKLEGKLTKNISQAKDISEHQNDAQHLTVMATEKGSYHNICMLVLGM